MSFINVQQADHLSSVGKTLYPYLPRRYQRQINMVLTVSKGLVINR